MAIYVCMDLVDNFYQKSWNSFKLWTLWNIAGHLSKHNKYYLIKNLTYGLENGNIKILFRFTKLCLCMFLNILM